MITTIPIVSFIGKPDSGKTTLLEKLVPELVRRGVRVGLIKHHVHDFEMDTPGKDTWRLKKAGCSAVLLSSPTGLGLVRDSKHDSKLQDLVDLYFNDFDLVLTEGYKQESFPKIEVFRAACHSDPLSTKSYEGHLYARITDTVESLQENDDGVYYFPLNEVELIVNFLLTTFLQAGDDG